MCCLHTVVLFPKPLNVRNILIELTPRSDRMRRFLCAYVKSIHRSCCPVKAYLTSFGLRLCVCLTLQVCMTQTRPWAEASWIFLKEVLKDSWPTWKKLPPKSSSQWQGERRIEPAVKHPCSCPTWTSAHALLKCVLACLWFRYDASVSAEPLTDLAEWRKRL